MRWTVPRQTKESVFVRGVGACRTRRGALALALLLAGCPDAPPPEDDGGAPGADAGDPGPEDAGDKTPQLVSLTLSPVDPELPIGASVRMSALGQYSDGSSEQLASAVAWSSDAPGVADVGSEGADAALVTAYAPGTATIRAAQGDVEASVVVTVLERAVVSLTVAPAAVTLAAGRSAQLSVTAAYDDDTSGDVTATVSWSSSAPAVADVDGAGLVQSLVEGSAVITATLGSESASSTITVGPPVVVEVSTFNKHAAALLSNGRVLAFGHNRYGQTGVAPSQTPDTCAADVDCGTGEVCDKNVSGALGVCSTACLVKADCAIGDVCDCEEHDAQGACTKGFCVDVVTAPTLVPGLTDVKRVVTTGFATFALTRDGRVLGLGRNTGGVFLGSGDDGGRSIERTPQPVMKRTEAGLAPLTDIVALAGGLEHVVALDESGQVWSFGRGWVGQVGDGDTTDESAAVAITVLPEGASERVPLLGDEVAAGSYHALVVERGSGRVYGWGWNGVGQLGDGTTVGPVSDNADTPAVDGQGWAEPICAKGTAGGCLTGASDVDAGWAHSVALVDGAVLAWGWNASGQLGDGSTSDRALAGGGALSDVTAIESGFVHVAALAGSGDLQLWGGNANGQLADGTTTNRPSPGPLALPGAVVQLSAGSDHTLALLDDGRVYVWGYNRWGELGLGDRALRNTPVLHPTLSP